MKDLTTRSARIARKTSRSLRRFAWAVVTSFAQRRFGLACAIGLLAPVLAFTDFGRYINTTLFVDPVGKVRALAGTIPPLDESIRIIAFDDGDLLKLGRRPTFREWHKIARHLYDAGYDRVFLHSFPNLSSDLKGSGSRDPRGLFIVGAASYLGSSNPRTVMPGELPKGALIPIPDVDIAFGTPGYYPEAHHLLAPALALFDRIDKIGHMNLAPSLAAVPVAYELRLGGHGILLPHISLWSTDKLEFSGGKFITSQGPIPRPHDGLLRADYIDPVDAANKSYPARLFFRSKSGKVRTQLPDKYKALLKGGRIAVLVPNAFSGGASFVETPNGLMATHLVTVSMINSVLHHKFLYLPYPIWMLILAWALVVGFVADRDRTGWAVGGLAFLGVTGYFGPALALDRAGWILPGAPFLLLSVCGIFVRATYHATGLWQQQIATAKDLELGRLVQDSLIASTFAGTVGDWTYQVAYEPYGPMSGDWVQVYERPVDAPETTPLAVIAIGDVVGKGPSAALSTAVIASTWSRAAARWDKGEFSAAAFLEDLNATLYRTFDGGQCSTISLTVLRPESVELIGCGAPAWMAVSTDAAGRSQSKGRPTRPHDPLGIEPAMTFHFKEFRLAARDILLAYTDGVMDSNSARKRFGKAIKAAGMPEGDGAFPYLVTEARRAGEGDVHPDDFTMVLVRRDRKDCEQGLPGTVHSVA